MKLIFYFNGNNLYSISKLAASLIGTKFEKFSVLFTHKNNLSKFVADNNNERLVLLFSFTTPDCFSVFERVSELKKFKNVITIAGGPHTSAMPQTAIDAGFDYAFVGEAEKTLPVLLAKLSDNYNRTAHQQIYINSETIDINEYPPFAYNLGLITPIEIMRGCINNCCYCQTPRLFKSVVFRKPQTIIPYLKYYQKQLRSFVNFAAPIGNFYYNGNIAKLAELFDTVKSNSNLNICFGHFPSELHPRFITKELLNLMNKYCSNRKISIGFQSGSERVLKSVNRNIQLEIMKESISLANEFGFTPIIDFLFGLPGETQNDRKLSSELILELRKKHNLLIHPHIFIPLPDTDLWNAEPSTLEPEFIEFIDKLSKLGKIRFNWREHLIIQKRIIEFRNRLSQK